jgi:hypothetical protein
MMMPGMMGMQQQNRPMGGGQYPPNMMWMKYELSGWDHWQQSTTSNVNKVVLQFHIEDSSIIDDRNDKT